MTVKTITSIGEVIQMTNDLISRQGAINKCRKRLYESAVNNVGYKCNADAVFVDIAENRIETWLNELPYAQPERKKGEWIKISPANIYECSECGKNVMTDDISAYDFCHGCGAEMEGEAE
mgnify:CR=1 FL=1